MRRVRPTPGSQLAAFVLYDYHAFITDRTGETLVLEADHRRNAEVENAIRDLKYGVGLNHLPSGRFAANGAWLAIQVMAHNLARWTARLGLSAGIVTTKTLRRRLFNVPGRLTRSARRMTLHLPARWPWAIGWTAALVRLRAIPLIADRTPIASRRSEAGGSLRRAATTSRRTHQRTGTVLPGPSIVPGQTSVHDRQRGRSSPAAVIKRSGAEVRWIRA